MAINLDIWGVENSPQKEFYTHLKEIRPSLINESKDSILEFFNNPHLSISIDEGDFYKLLYYVDYNNNNFSEILWNFFCSETVKMYFLTFKDNCLIKNQISDFLVFLEYRYKTKFWDIIKNNNSFLADINISKEHKSLTNTKISLIDDNIYKNEFLDCLHSLYKRDYESSLNFLIMLLAGDFQISIRGDADFDCMDSDFYLNFSYYHNLSNWDNLKYFLYGEVLQFGYFNYHFDIKYLYMWLITYCNKEYIKNRLISEKELKRDKNTIKLKDLL